MTACSVDGPGVINRSGGPTVDIVYCQHLVVTKDGAINEHDRGAAVSMDAATLECSVTKTGRRPPYKNTVLSIARVVINIRPTSFTSAGLTNVGPCSIQMWYRAGHTGRPINIRPTSFSFTVLC